MTLEKRLAAALKTCLMVRAGARLTPEIIEDRANNGVTYILEALREEQEQHTPVGYETAEQHAERVIK